MGFFGKMLIGCYLLLSQFKYVSWVLICRKSKPKCVGICTDKIYIDMVSELRAQVSLRYSDILELSLWAQILKLGKRKMSEKLLWFQRCQFYNDTINIKRAACVFVSKSETWSFMAVCCKGLSHYYTLTYRLSDSVAIALLGHVLQQGQRAFKITVSWEGVFLS